MKEINLLPKKSPEEEIVKQKIRVTYAVVIAFSVVLLLTWLLPFLFLQTLKLQERSLRQTITEKESSIEKLSEVERLYKTVFHKSTAASVILASKEIFLGDIVDLEGLLFPGIILRNITINKDKVKMAVNTSDIGLIITFLSNLEREEATVFFKDLTIASVSINPTTGYDVTIEGVLTHAQ